MVHAAYTILIESTPCCLNTTEYFVLEIVLRIILKFRIVVVKQRDGLEDLKVHGRGRVVILR